MRKSTTESGFTILELLVAMSVFVVLIGVVVNTFINGLRTQRALVELMAVNDNVALAIEQMSRELRTARDIGILPLTPVSSSGDAIRFQNTQGLFVSYRLDNNRLERGVCSTGIGCDSEDDFVYAFITGKNARVSQLLFERVDQTPGFGPQWPDRITVHLAITSADASLSDIVTPVQTTISSRILN